MMSQGPRLGFVAETGTICCYGDALSTIFLLASLVPCFLLFFCLLFFLFFFLSCIPVCLSSCPFVCAAAICYFFVLFCFYPHSSQFYSQVITPELPRSTTHVHRVITPAIVTVVVCSFPFTGYYATCSFHLLHHRGATRTNLLHMVCRRVFAVLPHFRLPKADDLIRVNFALTRYFGVVIETIRCFFLKYGSQLAIRLFLEVCSSPC